MSVLPGDFVATDFKSPGFSFRKARALAAASQLAYVDEAYIQPVLDTWRLALVTAWNIPSTDSQAFAAMNDELVVIAFRGTQEFIPDWIQNLKVGRKSHPLGGRTHVGFTDALESIWNDGLSDLLNDGNSKNKKVFFTGHSLGGALATILSAKVASTDGFDLPEAVYTFGQPLVGGKSFVRAFDAVYRGRFFRFRNHRDLVTRIPPKPLYSHVEDRIKFDKNGNIVDGIEPSFETFVGSLEEHGDSDVLDAAEFEGLQEQLAVSSALEEEGFFGRIVGIDDHSLAEKYLPILREHSSREISTESLTSDLESFSDASPNETVEIISSTTADWVRGVTALREEGELARAMTVAEEAKEANQAGAAEMVTALFHTIRHAPALLDSRFEGAHGLRPLDSGGFLSSGQPRPLNTTVYAQLSGEYRAYFDSCIVRPTKTDTVAWYLRRLKRHRDRYEALGNTLSIPWYFIGILHVLESNSDFGTHLHNGDSLSRRTVQVPRGRPASSNPPFTWEESATDALQMKGFHQEENWSVPNQLYRFERYNGFGYRPRYIPSPYLWSFSTHYSQGKFTSDGYFDENAVSRQVGAAVLLKSLEIDTDLS